ncbi:exonuclease domain-containing protein [Raineyella sp. LH-20]|uniref:exonuclease domain-containing protein n=1 Tax=Raineyella sp. LH-20 TaxID=3081204 RepID=UPI00295352F1|nr:exonuclease domain-containing protein [Raineyella sp. LH-20]WOP19701.1 exonuclease domain-containing protein [Raineyella sp. LH-20]
MGLDFVAIDFETANSSRASACAVGLAVVEGGLVTAQQGWLIRPPASACRFERRNIAIHGITAADCAARGLTWTETARRLEAMTDGRVAVAHNAPFDRSVWAAANAESGIATGTAPFVCTLDLARRAFPHLHRPLPNYKLDTVAMALALPAFHHHDAEDDAVTAAMIVIELARRVGRDDMAQLWPGGPTPPVTSPGRCTGARS